MAATTTMGAGQLPSRRLPRRATMPLSGCAQGGLGLCARGGGGRTLCSQKPAADARAGPRRRLPRTCMGVRIAGAAPFWRQASRAGLALPATQTVSVAVRARTISIAQHVRGRVQCPMVTGGLFISRDPTRERGKRVIAPLGLGMVAPNNHSRGLWPAAGPRLPAGRAHPHDLARGRLCAKAPSFPRRQRPAGVSAACPALTAKRAARARARFAGASNFARTRARALKCACGRGPGPGPASSSRCCLTSAQPTLTCAGAGARWTSATSTSTKGGLASHAYATHCGVQPRPSVLLRR
eukprot:scaffold7976_cov403-Prasinococcus_capsulatus_cf.AAC.8